MNSRHFFQGITLLTTLVWSSQLNAQGTQTVLGGGCDSHQPAIITGQLTIGSTLSIESSGCSNGDGSTILLFLGAALPTSQWIPLRLQTGFNNVETCRIGILPILLIDMSSRNEPIRIEIPNLPVLRGVRFATQTACNNCGFAGCFLGLSKIVEVTIG